MTTWILPLVQDQASPSRLPLEQDQASPSPGAGPGLPFPVSSGAGPGLPFPRSRTRPLTSLEQDVASPSVPLEQDRTSTSPGAGRGLPVPWSRTMPHPVPFRTAAACWHARIETDDLPWSRTRPPRLLEQDETSPSPGAGPGRIWCHSEFRMSVPFGTAAACWHAQKETDDFGVFSR